MRQTVGFDRFSDLFEQLMNGPSEGSDHYPPYNIERLGEDKYRITMAVAGFKMDDLNIVLQSGELNVSGAMKDRETEAGAQVLHRGIATRAFQKTFRLADYIQVTGAELKDGLLTIHLFREVPEEKKPRMVPIRNGGGAEQSDSKKGKN
jgi:molecular chaperone IbpA